MRLTLTFHSNNKVTRKYDKSYEKSDYGKALKGIFKAKTFAPKFAQAFTTIHKDEKDKNDITEGHLTKILRNQIIKKTSVRFKKDNIAGLHLGDLFLALREKARCGNIKTFIIILKACREYYFYALEAVKENGEREPIHWPYFRKATFPKTPSEEHLRGIADTILFLAPKLKDRIKNKDRIVDLLRWFTIELHCDIVDRKKRRSSIQLEVKPKIWESKRIELCKDTKNKTQILVSSPNFLHAISELSEVWLSLDPKSVLLSGWTGSGKECLVDLLTYAMCVNSKKSRIDVSAAATNSFNDLEQKIIDNYAKREHNSQQEERVIFFLDEIHHDQEDTKFIRSGLLRLMSTNELINPSNKEIINCKSILYVLATSIQPDRIRTLKPPDLWTRIEHTVALSHPLRSIDNDTERKDILKDYFELFWELELESLNKRRRLNNTIKNSLKKFTKNYSGKVAEIFAEQLGSPFILMLLSIREIQSIVKRLFGKVMNELRIDPSQTKKVMNTFEKEKWLLTIFKGLIPQIDPRGAF